MFKTHYSLFVVNIIVCAFVCCRPCFAGIDLEAVNYGYKIPKLHNTMEVLLEDYTKSRAPEDSIDRTNSETSANASSYDMKVTSCKEPTSTDSHVSFWDDRNGSEDTSDDTTSDDTTSHSPEDVNFDDVSDLSDIQSHDVQELSSDISACNKALDMSVILDSQVSIDSGIGKDSVGNELSRNASALEKNIYCDITGNSDTEDCKYYVDIYDFHGV